MSSPSSTSTQTAGVTAEYATPARYEFDPAEVLTDAIVRNANDDPARVAFRRRVGSGWVPVTTKEFADQVREVAAGLVARGVQPGNRVALMSRTRYEWAVFDYAIWTAGGVTVPVYETSSADQVEWILSDSDAVFAVVESEAHEHVLASVRDRLPKVTDVVVIDAGAIDALTAEGRQVPGSELEARRQAMTASTLATIIYTSGTTGRPKGCELDHGALVFDGRTTALWLPDLFKAGESSTLMFLPLAHIFGRAAQCGCIASGITIGHTADVKNLVQDIGEFKPTFILSVPRVFEKIFNGIGAKARAEGKGEIFRLADKTAVAYSEALDSKKGPGIGLRLRHGLFDKLVYSKLRAALGGNLSFAVSGGAPLGARLGHYFRGAGVLILEGYGLTETSAGATVNRPDNQKIGTVGPPIPGTGVRIAEDGEVLLRGRNLLTGYWQNPTATAEVLDEGWFHTGDLGSLDSDGFLTITGRKKELIVTAGGKNVSPSQLEDRMRRNPLVSQVVVVGDAKPFIAALFTLDEEALPTWLKEHDKPGDLSPAALKDDSDIRAALQAVVDDANTTVSRAESIRAFAVLPEDFSEDAGTLTPSLKVKRAVVADKYAAAIEGIYNGAKP